MSNNFKNSRISDTAKLFSNIRCVNSIISGGCTIGDDCDIMNCVMEEKSELGRRNLIRNTSLGKGSYTGTNTIIKQSRIGKFCCISWNVSIGGSNHNYKNVSLYTDYWHNRTFDAGIEIKEPEKPSVIIGNDVWIGSGCNILEGVTIGNGCVIGAGSVFTKDVEPYSVVVGVPARTIKKRFSDEIIELLEHIEWWNWTDDKIKENIEFLRNEPNTDVLREIINNHLQ